MQTINNKRQLAIPVQPETLLDRLSGSIKIPKRFEGFGLEEIIDKAKAEYFEKSR